MKKLLTLLALLLPGLLFAQKKIGAVKGSVYDSLNDYALQSASVTVFKQADSSIVEFQLSNETGEFDIKNLPVRTPLYFVVTHTGYRSFLANFQLDSTAPVKDFKKLSLLLKGDGEMEEVTIKAVQPIRMNGDTLEINPDAFKLDSSAVVEDMLLRVPGLT
ncbi:MAG: carboxypeptidase-like regulatory domain-containing protein, partial [Niabella sp.]